MAENNFSKKLPLASIMRESWQYCNHNPKVTALFIVLNYLVCAAGLYSWKTVWLWPVLVLMYILWSGFFRYYFNRKPYLMLKPLLYSTVPSTKILVLTILVVSAFLMLPYLIMFIPNLPPAFVDGYAYFLQLNMQQDNDLLDMMVNVVVVLFSPLIFYRPMLAWIATLIGRSGSLKFAWGKTEGNYWEFLLLAIVIDLSTSFIYKGVLLAGGNVYAALLPLSVMIVYFNIVVARLYSFFFLEVEVV